MRQQTQETSMRKEVIIASTVGLLCMLELCAPTKAVSLDVVEVSPYLLLATTAHIHRMNLDGSGLEVLVNERNFGILGLEYHYRLNLLFWTNVMEPSIKQANLDGSNIRTIVTSGPGDLELDYPVDLALDWINDKLYWTDRGIKIIGVYDLVTGERRVILSTGDSTSLPFGLAIYPFPDYGWLYWVDRGKETLEVAAVTGEGREVLESGRRVNCAWPLTLDYSEHTIYWINYCDRRMLSLNMDGSQSSQSVHVRNIDFSHSISYFNDTIFWTQQLSAYSADILQTEPAAHTIIRTSSRDGGARAIAAVHPMQQPTAEIFRTIVDTGTAVCDPPCANGICVDPDLCYCDRGWTGLSCSKDINECDTANGECEQRCINTPGSYECVCFEGFVFNENMTCEDVNECEISNGGCDHNCTNFEGSYECSCLADFVLGTDGRSCACPEGYATRDNITCEDVNECNVSNGGCEHNCTNSEGSYECSCLPNFNLSPDGRCDDIDECLVTNGGCSQRCINLPGSYECLCFDGYISNENEICGDVNECNVSNGGCEHNCTNSEGSYECSCLPNFNLSLDGRCDDIDECLVANGGCPQRCINLPGSYECLCFDGYIFNENGTCEDVNECNVSNGGCEHNCTNSEGSYECSCLPNFNLSPDGRCDDIDECLVTNGGCSQRCINLPGSYECLCFDGYISNENEICEDVNECNVSNGGCEHNCTNSEGSYECSCLPHFNLSPDGRCDDIDECLVTNGGCPQRCINLPGSYECLCLDGYIFNENGICEEVNECKNLNGGCTHNCTNFEGSYECSCLEGFVLEIDGRSCKVNVSTGVMETATSPTHIIPTLTSLVYGPSVATTLPDEVLETSRLYTSTAATSTSSIVNIPQQSSAPSTVRTTQHIPLSSSNEITKLHTSVAAITSSFANTPQQSSIPSPVRTVLSSSSTQGISSFVPVHISTTVHALRPLPTTTSSLQMLANTVQLTQPLAIPITSTTEASSTSSRSRTIPSSTSTMHTSPSVSMDASPSPEIDEPQTSTTTMLVIVAAAASAGVIAVAVVVMVIVAILMYRWRAHKSGSWSPPRNTADSPTDPTDSIKYTTSASTMYTTSVGDSNEIF